jgi:mono/diheme cytochrome c family protein
VITSIAKADQAADQMLIKQGEYVVRTGDCIACHTDRGGKPFAGGLPLQTPIGAVYTTNITPDNDTGIGSWSYDDFVQLMRRGIHKKGYTVYPAMPFPSFSRMSDDDLKSLYGYLMHGVAPVRQVNRPPDIVWPLSMRWPLTVWRWLFAPTPRPFQPPPGADTRIARGAYLVEVPGHCGACHTPRNFSMQEKALSSSDGKLYLSGGSAVDGWIPPSLRNEHGGGLADWSESDIVQLLKTASNPESATFGGMNDVVVHSMQHLADDDVAGIAAYLKSLSPNHDAAPMRIRTRSRRRCSTAMHRRTARSSTSIDAPAATAPTARAMDGCFRRLPAIPCCRQGTRRLPSISSCPAVCCRQQGPRLPPSPWRPTTGSLRIKTSPMS